MVGNSCGNKPNKIGTALRPLNEKDGMKELLNQTKTIQVY